MNMFWRSFKSAPFGIWILLLWEGGQVLHREVVKGFIPVNSDFVRKEYWNGYEYNKIDEHFIGWMYLPSVELEIIDE